MSYCNSCIYYTHNYCIDKYYCVAPKIALIVTPSEHKPAFCAGHSEKEKKMSDIKLEVGQIWLADYDNTEARKILHIGELQLFYARMDSEGIVIEETSVSPHRFLSDYANKLLPCWPKKKKVSKALAIYKEKKSNSTDEYVYYLAGKYYESEENTRKDLGDSFVGFAEWSREDFEE